MLCGHCATYEALSDDKVDSDTQGIRTIADGTKACGVRIPEEVLIGYPICIPQWRAEIPPEQSVCCSSASNPDRRACRRMSPACRLSFTVENLQPGARGRIAMVLGDRLLLHVQNIPVSYYIFFPVPTPRATLSVSVVRLARPQASSPGTVGRRESLDPHRHESRSHLAIDVLKPARFERLRL